MKKKIIKIFLKIIINFACFSLVACNHIDRKVELPNKRKLTPISQPIKLVKSLDRKVLNLNAEYVLNSALTFASHKQQVFAADLNRNILAFDAQNGKLLWKVKLPHKVTAGPVWLDGHIVVATEGQKLLCLNVNTRDLLWSINLSSEALALPKVAGKTVFVHTLDGGLTAINSLDGKQLWRVSTVMPCITLRRGSTPAVFKDQVINGFANGKLFVINKDHGTILWNKDLVAPKGRSELQRIADLVADPIVYDRIIYAISYQGNLTAIDLKQGELIWEKPLSSYAGMELDPGSASSLYVASLDGKVLAIERKNGNVIWQQDELEGRNLSKPAIFKNYIVVGDQEGNLHFLDRLHGFIKGRIKLSNAGIFIPPKIDEQQRLQILTNDGRFVVLDMAE